MRKIITCLIGILVIIANCPPLCISDDNTLKKENIFSGEKKHMGNGKVWSWVVKDSDGKPTSIGITFTEMALSGLSESDIPTVEYELSLPKQAKVGPYNHIVVNWNPHGHIPPGIYDVPHFDFHFYMISPGNRYKITAKGKDIVKSNKKLPEKYIPQGYILPDGTQEPRMGSHWVDPSSPEFNKQTFTRTFIYGSYNGEMTFLEPMASKPFLGTRPNITEKIKLPAEYKKHGYYPTSYSIKFDSVRKEYTVSLNGLTYR